jgi:acyl-CoA thioesterase FadM
MEDNYQKNYDLIISELEIDFNAEIELIDKLYIKHKE